VNKSTKTQDRVRAVIVENGKVLLIKRTGVKGENTFWVSPGGGVDTNENHETALKRECLEECGIEVRVGKLLYQEISDHPITTGQTLFFYSCMITGGIVGSGRGPEFQPSDFYEGTHEPEWIALKDLLNIDLRPKKFQEFILSQYSSPLIEFLDSKVNIQIDRPLGSLHPKWNFPYPVNYGYIPDTKSGDGEEIDAYVLGVHEPLKEFTGKCIAIIHRLNDNDDKLVLVPKGSNLSDEEIKSATDFQEKFFKSVIVR
jgi:inorganic pyrophosphatase